MAERWTRAIDEKIAAGAMLARVANDPLIKLLDSPGIEEDIAAADRLAPVIYRAVPYWVAPDLAALVGVAYSTLPPEFRLAPHHFPTTSGYVLLEHEGRPPAEFNTNDRERAVRALFWNHDGYEIECGVVPAAIEWRPGHGERADAINFAVWMRSFLERVPFSAAGDQSWQVAMLSAFLLLAGERLTVTTYERPAREQRRRAAKANEPPPPDIRVVKLRAVDRHKGDSTGDLGEYDYRWLVRGHWHRYWVGPVGEQRLEPKWVSPYVKGPDDKPLRVHSGDLYAVVR